MGLVRWFQSRHWGWSGTVLVIDDEPVVHEILARTLIRHGFRIEGAFNSEDGLRIARRIRPQAITLDGKVQKVHDLRNPCARHVAQAREVCVVADLATLDHLLELDGEAMSRVIRGIRARLPVLGCPPLEACGLRQTSSGPDTPPRRSTGPQYYGTIRRYGSRLSGFIGGPKW